MLQGCGLIWAFCCPTRLDSFGTECSRLHWRAPAILQGSTARDRDFTLYSIASKYMPHNFQCSEDKVMNSIFPTKKKNLRNSFFIVVHENDMLVPTWEHGPVKDYALWFLLCPRLGLCYWTFLVFYLHFQIQNIATQAIYEKLESESLLWDLDGIQTCRGNHPMLAISWTDTLYPHLSPHSTFVHRDTPQLALHTSWVCV